MLQIPRVPTVRPIFPGVAAHQLRQELAMEIRATCEALIKSTYVPSYQEMFRRYTMAVDPGEIRDPCRLPPYATQGPNDARGVSKIGCVYARLSWVLKLYWDLCLDGADNAAALRQYLTGLRAVAERGVEKCVMEGDTRMGFWLGVPA